MDFKKLAVPAVLKLTIITVVKLNSRIIEAKKIISRASTRPRLIVKKWVSKLNEAIISTIESGANKRKKDKTYSKPLSMNSKLAITARTKAIT